MSVPIYNKRILQIADEFKTGNKMTKAEFFDKIGAHYGNLSHYRSGKVGFTIDQVISVAKLAKVSTDWLLGISEQKHKDNVKIDPLDQILEAVSQLKKKR